MIGLNGGLLGVRRTPTRDVIPGVWTPNEQILYRRTNNWYTPPDPQFSNVSLLVQPEGTSGTNSFADASNGNIPITAIGNAQHSSTQKLFRSTSLAVLANGDYLSFPNTADPITFGSSDFTVEAWIYLLTPTVNPFGIERCIMGLWSGVNPGAQAWILYTNGTDIAFTGDIVTNDNTVFSVAHGITTEKWTHVAVVRSGATMSLYLDGAFMVSGSVGTGSFTTGSNTAGIGGYNRGTGGTASMYGYIESVRVTKNFARYTSAFSVPTDTFPVF